MWVARSRPVTGLRDVPDQNALWTVLRPAAALPTQWDPVAQALERRSVSALAALGRLWVLVLAFNLVGDGLQDALNPKSTKSS